MNRYAFADHHAEPAPRSDMASPSIEAASSAASATAKRWMVDPAGRAKSPQALFPPASLLPHPASWHLPSLGFPALWSRCAGEGVTVALIDSGVGIGNPWLKDAVIARGSVFDDDDGGDRTGHGTRCAGLIGGQSGPLSFGIAPRASIVSIRAVDAFGFLAPGGFERALEMAREAGAQVISVSLAVPELSSGERAAFESIIREGSALIVAANEDRPGAEALFPAALDGVVSVGAVTRDLRPLPSWPVTRPSLSIAAYGEQLLTTTPTGNLDLFSGTSAAVPLISGTAALLLSLARDASARTWAIRELSSSLVGAPDASLPWSPPPVLLNPGHAARAMEALLGRENR